MTVPRVLLVAMALCACSILLPAADKTKPKSGSASNAPAQSMDAGYTAKIKQFTTEPFFLTELVDHLPASDQVPTPEKVLGYAIGTPDRLTYTRDIYRYLRELEKATPRVKVWSMGRSEEGREMLLVAVSDESNIKRLERLKQINAALADPRRTSPAEAAKLIDEAVPMYWATGSIHSPETGSPEMLMEMAYRLAVEDSPFIQNLRRNLVVLITPVIEVDGRDKQVDLYNWRKAKPGRPAPNLVYWGKYVAHDNNRDGMVLSLALSRNLMSTFLDWHPTVLHDLHESVPFLYISTGMGPYNAWLDPILVNEWQKMAYHEIEEMTKRGVPGVWTHGFYDGWAANYMFYVANGHNAIGRFYETFGGRGADTGIRTVQASQTSRTWFRPNPPLERVNWSIRNNINMQQSAILLGMDYTARNGKEFLNNFYLKSKRSIEKATTEGPAAWVIPGDDPRPVECADMVNLLRLQGVEVQRATAAGAFTVRSGRTETKVNVPAGSYVIRMDQPYSRMADMLLDTQYYNVNDTAPYDDTGWTMGPLRNIRTVRVTDPAILKLGMTPLTADAKVDGKLAGSGTWGYAIDHNAENTLMPLRYALRDVAVHAAEKGFEAAGHSFHAGTFLIPAEGNPADLRTRLEAAAREAGVTAYALADAPKGVTTHKIGTPRIALVHTWINTQNEGWYRVAFDRLKVPYEYISDQKLRQIASLRDRFDVVLLGPVGGTSQRIVNGLPQRGEAMPWMKSELTPNLGMSPDTTEDMRGGMGLEGVMKIRDFVDQGGLFILIGSNSSIAMDYGLIEGVSITPARELKARGSVLNAVVADAGSPVTYGYSDKLAVYFNQAPIFSVSTTGGLLGGFGGGEGGAGGRVSGRGTPTDPDIVQGRPYTAPQPRPEVRPEEEPPVPEDMMEMVRGMLPPPGERPRVVLKFAEEKDLFVSGMLAGGRELAGKPAIVDVPRGKGHILLFANNPVWRQETQGSFFLLFNAMLNYDSLGVGRTAPAARPQRPASAGGE